MKAWSEGPFNKDWLLAIIADRRLRRSQAVRIATELSCQYMLAE
jgi:hypothetical protein